MSKASRNGNVTRRANPERKHLSLGGEAKRFWEEIQQMYPDKSDSERLLQLKGQLTDPWSVAWTHHEKFQQLAYGHVSRDHYALIERLRAIHIQIREGGIDPGEVDEALDLVKSKTNVAVEKKARS